MNYLHLSKLFCKALQEGVVKPSLVSIDRGLSDVQYAALRFIKLHPEVSLQQLAHGLEISSPATTKLVDRLEERKWVQRVSHAKDRRRWVLKLTDEGEHIGEQVVNYQKQQLAALVDKLTDQERTALISAIESFVNVVLAGELEKEQLCLKCGTDHEPDCILTRL